MKHTLLFLISLSAHLLSAAVFNVTDVSSLQSALTTASANGEDDIITVAAGLYTPAAPLEYHATEAYSIDIRGADADTTIIDGQHAILPLSLQNDAEGDLYLSGITCRNGSNSVDEIGGGALIVCNGDGSCYVSDCIFSNNCAVRTAGGVYIGVSDGAITVTQCRAAYNTTVIDDGGGIYLYKESGSNCIYIADCVLHDNYLNYHPEAVGGIEGSGLFIYYLGAYCDIIVSNTILRNNRQISGGGCFYVRATSGGNITLADSTFYSNHAGGDSEMRGGAVNIELETGIMNIVRNIFNSNSVCMSGGGEGDGGGIAATFNTAGSFLMKDNVFIHNSVNRHGGGANIGLGANVNPAHIVQNVFVENYAGVSDSVGGGLQLNTECDVAMINNTFYGNTAADAGGCGFYTESTGNTLEIYNDIYRQDTPNAIGQVGLGPVQAFYANIEGGSGESYYGVGCIDANPLFLDVTSPAGADGMWKDNDDGFQLTEGSPCIDAGTNYLFSVWGPRDIAGNIRNADAIDMGAYEMIPEPVEFALIMCIAGWLCRRVL